MSSNKGSLLHKHPSIFNPTQHHNHSSNKAAQASSGIHTRRCRRPDAPPALNPIKQYLTYSTSLRFGGEVSEVSGQGGRLIRRSGPHKSASLKAPASILQESHHRSGSEADSWSRLDDHQKSLMLLQNLGATYLAVVVPPWAGPHHTASIPCQ